MLNSSKQEYEPLVGHSSKSGLVKRNRRRTLSCIALASIALIVTGLFVIKEHGAPVDHVPPKKPASAIYTQGAVAAETEECSIIGTKMLRKGGTAVDAAIAASLCLGVVNNFASGIGGGGVMVVRSPNGSFEAIDFRETAPAASTYDMFEDEPMLARRGGLAVAVPGEIKGFELAHQRHGRLPWATLFDPAIQMARDGFKVPKLLEKTLEEHWEWMSKEPVWVGTYGVQDKNGRHHHAKFGDTLRRPRLAHSLELIAQHGAKIYYDGIIGEALVNATDAAGGILTRDDLRSYRAVIRSTVNTYYHGRKITTCTLPSSGPVLLSVLNMMERFNFKAEENKDLNVHRLIEGLKFGYALRTELGDPDFIDIGSRLDEIMSKEYSSDIRRNISDETTFPPLYYGPKYDKIENHGTMHISVVDKDDGAVALTTTVNLGFGSRLMDPVTGIILNNEMDDFSIPGQPNAFDLYPSKMNYIAPGKRPLSSMSPTIVERDGMFELAVGGSGGSKIISSVLNVLLNYLDNGHDLLDAVATPRVHHQLLPNKVDIETGIDQQIVKSLRKRGHEIYQLGKGDTISAVEMVGRAADGTVQAASDPRKFALGSAY